MNVKEFVNNHMKRIGYIVNDANVENLKLKYTKRFRTHPQELTDKEAKFYLYNSDAIVLETLRKIRGK